MGKKSKSNTARNIFRTGGIKVWIPIIVALIGLIGTLVAAEMGCWGTIVAALLPSYIQANRPTQALQATALPSQMTCPQSEGVAFDSGSLDGWQIRYEGAVRLGEGLSLSSEIPCTDAKDSALAFSFQLLNYRHAQIGLEGKNLPLSMEMSAWVYNPPDGPVTLAGQCFVLTGPEPAWKWYDTAPVKLPAGQWVKLA